MTSAKLFARPASPRPLPPLGPLAGDFASPIFGKVSVSEGDGALVVAFEATGARLKLAPWEGEVFTVALIPEGRFAPMAANFGPKPLGFVQFQTDQTGKLDRFSFSIEDGQTYLFLKE